jgi:hypothetical protein
MSRSNPLGNARRLGKKQSTRAPYKRALPQHARNRIAATRGTLRLRAPKQCQQQATVSTRAATDSCDRKFIQSIAMDYHDPFRPAEVRLGARRDDLDHSLEEKHSAKVCCIIVVVSDV